MSSVWFTSKCLDGSPCKARFSQGRIENKHDKRIKTEKKGKDRNGCKKTFHVAVPSTLPTLVRHGWSISGWMPLALRLLLSIGGPKEWNPPSKTLSEKGEVHSTCTSQNKMFKESVLSILYNYTVCIILIM